MAAIKDFSYRYPIHRPPNTTFITDVQTKKAHEPIVTGLSGSCDQYDNYMEFGPDISVGKRRLPNLGRLSQLVPLERNLHRDQPAKPQDYSTRTEKPGDQYSMRDFWRFRYLKESLPNVVRRVPDITAYNYCPTCCASHVGQLPGCRRNSTYAYCLPERRRTFIDGGPKPHAPYGRGYYGYLHQQLDNHATGNFWLSKHHS